MAFLVGIGWLTCYTATIASWKLPKELESKSILVAGYISNIPTVNSTKTVFELTTTTINHSKQKTKLKLSWHNPQSPQPSKSSPKLTPGSNWQLMVRLKRPHSTLNPGSFDNEKYSLVKGIRAIGYVVESDQNQLLSLVNRYQLLRLRATIANQITHHLRSKPLHPIIIALTTGITDKIEQTQWQIFRNTGTNHLVAISGLHLCLVASIGLVITKALWRRFKLLPLSLPTQEAGIIGGLIIALSYALIAGLSIPTQRALIALSAIGVFSLLRRFTNPWNILLWSLLAVLLLSPLSQLTASFWLSFGAVFAIAYTNHQRINLNQGYWHSFWRLQTAITLTLMPLTLLFFQQFSLTTFIANLVAVPIIGSIVTPLSLLGISCLLLYEKLGVVILHVAVDLLNLVWLYLDFISLNTAKINLHLSISEPWIIFTSLIGIVLLLAPRGLPTKYLGVCWLVPIFFPPSLTPANHQLFFTILDVGQGLASIIQTTNHSLIYDTGLKYSSGNSADSIILPYLIKKKINQLDVLIVSHGDNDHSGGAISILKETPVKKLITSAPEMFENYQPLTCHSNQSWQWDGIKFEFLSPPLNSKFNSNNNSCVLKVSNDFFTLLLPGDIEKEGERFLLANYQDQLKTTILIAPHHGSTSSSSEKIVRAFNPQFVIFATGYKNRFRLPSRKVVDRYLKNGATLLNTSETGAIKFTVDTKTGTIKYQTYRKQHRHFWHDL